MPLNVAQAENARDALVKTLYTNFHGWLVEQINSKIKPADFDDHQRNYIGILDMPGFGEHSEHSCFQPSSDELGSDVCKKIYRFFCRVLSYEFIRAATDKFRERIDSTILHEECGERAFHIGRFPP